MNRSDRESDFLTIGQVHELIAATAHAFCIGQPLNLYLSINWGRARIRCSAQEATWKYLKLFEDWLRKKERKHKAKPASPAWVLVQEHPPPKGENTHILAHCPLEYVEEFMRRKDAWAENPKIGATFQERGRVVNAQTVIGSFPEYDLFRYLENLKRTLGYFLKGLNQLQYPGYDIKYENQGVILGKRCGTSQLLTANGRAKDARSRARNVHSVRLASGRQFRLVHPYDRHRHFIDRIGLTLQGYRVKGDG
ncbi:MAG: hypothetical protein NVV74_15905 [Magnetospirillum sp.]|nr:hypothetical protein [Magnetospirillum sp.]